MNAGRLLGGIARYPETPDGFEAFIRNLTDLAERYPEMSPEIKRAMAEDDMVVTHGLPKFSPPPESPRRRRGAAVSLVDVGKPMEGEMRERNAGSSGIEESAEASGSRKPVTVVGLGPMGAALAHAFLKAGHPTTVWNRSANKADALVARGARRADALGGAVSASTLVVLCLSDYEAMHQVLDPLGDALSGKVLANLGSGTPEQAREAAAWAAEHGADYLDGAIMVPPPAVGRPDAVFFYSGPEAVFEAHEPALKTLGGDARYLGADPGLAVLYNTALLGMMWSTVNGFLHAVALVGTAKATASEFAPVAVDWFLPAVVSPIITAATRQLDKGEYPGDEGTLEMNLAAADHLLRTSRDQGIGVEVPAFLKRLLERAIAEGHGSDSYMSLIEVLKRPMPRA